MYRYDLSLRGLTEYVVGALLLATLVLVVIA